VNVVAGRVDSAESKCLAAAGAVILRRSPACFRLADEAVSGRR
jgi:hypothetical protein